VRIAAGHARRVVKVFLVPDEREVRGRVTSDGDRPDPELADRARRAVATKDLVRDVDRIEVDHLASAEKHPCPYRN
jgi:hypothetical protein